MNKLVRDKIVEIIKREGKEVNFEVLGDKEYLQALKTKLLEEAKEVNQTSNPLDTLAELADLQELIDCLLEHLGLSKDDLQEAQDKKNLNKGSFKNRHFIKD